MNRVGMRCNAAWWLWAVVAASRLATGAWAAGAKQKAKVVAPKAVMPDSAHPQPRASQTISVEKLRLIPTDNMMQAPVFPPLGHQTPDELERLRRLNMKREGALTIAPYPSPVIDRGELHFRGGRPHDITWQFDGKSVVPAPTRSDTAGSGSLPKAKRGSVVPRPH